MKKIKTIIFGCWILGFGLTNLKAQSNTVAAGGQANGVGGTASYSIGQVDYNTAPGSGGTVTQGLQQPYEILVISGIEQTSINLFASIYPNPTAEFVTLTLKVESNKIENYTYQLYDLQGKLLVNNKVEGNQTTISMAGLVNATYFIKVLNNNKEVKQFKIIKNK